MSTSVSVLPFGMRPEVARRRIEVFRKRFGNAHLYLAYHAAFPIALTPDLVYRLRATFQRDVYGNLLNIPWIAVADLLLSSLCEEVGYELYEMNVAVRNELLNQLREHENFGEQRISGLSNFLLKYVGQQLNSHDPDTRDFAHAQYWTALVATRPEEAAHSIALTLSKLDARDRAGFARMKSLIETLGEPSDEFATLLAYTKSMEQYARGVDLPIPQDLQTPTEETGEPPLPQTPVTSERAELKDYLINGEQAANELNTIIKTGQTLNIQGVNLPLPGQLSDEIRKGRIEQTARKNFYISYHNADRSWAEWIGWQLEEAGYSILLQQWDYRVTADFTLELDRATQEAERVIVVLSPDYLEALATLPSWIEAFHVDPRNDPNILIALQVRECSDQLSKLLGLIVYTNLFEMDEKEALEALLSRIYKATPQPRLSLESHIETQHLVQDQPAFPRSLSIPPPLLSSTEQGRPIQVLYCYADKDELLLNQLREFLLPLKHQGLIVDWYDRDVIIASEWEQEINRHLNSAQLILLLISVDFLYSDYCWSKEMLRAIERHEAGEARVVPIILRPCEWEKAPFGNLQVLPRGGRPLTLWANQEEAFKGIVDSIREIIEEMIITGGKRLPDHRNLVMSPPPTDPQIIQQRERTIEDVYGKLTQTGISSIALTGMGGIGKSTLAALIYRYAEMQQRAGNGPFKAPPLWLSIDPAVTLADILSNLCKALNARLPNVNSLSPQDQAITLFNILNNENKPRLIVFDQFENILDTSGHAKEDRQGIGEWLDLLNSHPCVCRILFTSRLDPHGTHDDPPTCLQTYPVEGLSETEEAELLRTSTGETSIQRAKGSMGAVTTLLLCYTHEDERMVRQLKKHLSMLERTGLITLWDYGNISPSAEWEQEIEKKIDEVQIILLFISPSFLDSNFCYKVEMQRAIQRHERKEARVIPVILRPAHWMEPPLDKLQALPDHAKPISTWATRDEGFKNVADGIKKVIEQRDAHSLPGSIPGRQASPLSLLTPQEEKIFQLVRLGLSNKQIASQLSISRFTVGKHIQNILRILGVANRTQAASYASSEREAQLDQLIETVKSQMQPPARATAMAISLQQLSIYIPNDVTLADLVVGWRTLAQASKPQEEPATTQRRVTCGELATLASQFTTDQGNLAQAIKTWRIWQETFKNSDDPRRATMARTFARELTELQEAPPLLQVDARQNSEAEISPAPLYQRAITIDEQALGPEHPNLATDLNNLAEFYREQGEYEKAEGLYQRAITIDEQVLGPEHPDLAIWLNNLANLYAEQGEYEKAEPLYRRARHQN